MMGQKSALLRQVWKATTSRVVLLHSSNWMESDAWLQGGNAETNLKLLVVTENRANGVYFPRSDWCVYQSHLCRSKTTPFIVVYYHKVVKHPLSQTTDDPTIGNPDEEPATKGNDETAHRDRQ